MTDWELCQQVQAGGPAADQAYSELLDRHKGAVLHATANLYAPGETWEDLRQAALLGLWEAALSWDQRQPFHQWARFVAHRKVITLVKLSTRAKHAPMKGYGELHLAPEPIWEAGPSEQESVDYVAEIAGDVGLTPLEADVLCKWLEGFPYEQITGNPKRADNALQRVKKKTREWIEEECRTDRTRAVS